MMRVLNGLRAIVVMAVFHPIYLAPSNFPQNPKIKQNATKQNRTKRLFPEYI